MDDSSKEGTINLFLDLNGLICLRVDGSSPSISGIKELKVFKDKLYLRPREEVEELLDYLSKRTVLSIYSSMTMKNITPLLKHYQLKDRFRFILSREYTQLDPEYGGDPDISAHATIKTVGAIIKNPVINGDRKLNIENVLICDDSFSKLRFNNPNNILIVEPWNPLDDGAANLEQMKTMIDEKIERLRGLV